jgi:transposase
MATGTPLTLRDGDRGRLEALARSTSVRPSLAQRARIVLLSAEGLPTTEIARRAGCTRPTVLNWRNRYAKGGLNALRDLPRPGRPAEVDELQVVATTLADGGRPPAHLGASHWSARLLGEHLGISFATVARIWRKWGIRPDHVQTFAFSPDLISQAKARDLGGLYWNLSHRAAALHRPASVPSEADAGSPGSHPDPWLRLVEVSLGIITQQAIRRGTFASVRNLIEALGALTDGWQDRPEPSHPPVTSGNATRHRLGINRQITSDTAGARQERSSRSGENHPPGVSQPPPNRTRDPKSVRAEFHGTRGRRSRPLIGPGA